MEEKEGEDKWEGRNVFLSVSCSCESVSCFKKKEKSKKKKSSWDGRKPGNFLTQFEISHKIIRSWTTALEEGERESGSSRWEEAGKTHVWVNS